MPEADLQPERVELAFYGEIAAGHAPDEARRKLSAAIGIAPDQVDTVFSGRRIVLKKDVPPGEAPRLIAKLASIGIVARAESGGGANATAESVVSAPAGSQTDVPVAAAPLALIDDTPPSSPVAPVEEVECPKCGTRQPKRTLCVSCSTDMPRYAAAQRVLKDEDRAAKLAALKGNVAPPPVARKFEEEPDYAIEGASLLGTGFDGRIGRIAYFVGGIAMLSVLTFGTIASLKSGFWLLMAPLLLGVLFVSVRLAILRCHDMNWSGWWSLLSLVPYVGTGFSLVLSVVPGTRGSNDFGRATRPPGMPAVGISLFVMLLATMLAFSQMTRLMSMLNSYGVTGTHASSEPDAALENYDPKANSVVMYSLTTCGYCAQKRRELSEMGIRYTELFIDDDSNARAQLDARLEEAHFPRQSYGTPILDVNGIILPNNPPIEDIIKQLRGRSS